MTNFQIHVIHNNKLIKTEEYKNILKSILSENKEGILKKSKESKHKASEGI